MMFTAIFLAIVLVTGESRSLNLQNPLLSENRVQGDNETLRKPYFATAPSSHMDKGNKREKRDVSQLNIPQLTIAANLLSESVCPWTYRNDSKENRRPVDLVEAVCIQPNGTDSVCLRIFYFIPVQEKMTSPDGTVTWVDKLEKKVVGCTLLRTIIVDNDSMATRD